MKIKIKKPKTQRNAPESDPDGILSRSQAEELRTILSDEENAVLFVKFFAKKSAEDFGDERIRRLFESITSREAERGVRMIFKYCESPIEKIFFCSCINAFLKSNIMFHFMAPPEDFVKDAKDFDSFQTKLFRCYSFYKSLPDDARPKTFLNFLEMTGVESGELPQEEAERLAGDACCHFDLGFMHVVHFVLQPTFPNFAYGKTVRPDAALWVPSNPGFKLIVECDGFEFHGDKETFSRDRARDRAFGNAGYSVRRYSGQEIHNQPVVTSMDLLTLVVDKDLYTHPTQKQWERTALKGEKAPSSELIESWRSRMAQEREALHG